MDSKRRLQDKLRPIKQTKHELKTQDLMPKKALKAISQVQKLHRPITGQTVQRKTAFASVSERVTAKWEETVLTNRVRDQLVFPLNQDKLEESLVDNQPESTNQSQSTNQSPNDLQDNQVLTSRERQLLSCLTKQECLDRLKQLQKMRALMSFQEKKLWREKRAKRKKKREPVEQDVEKLRALERTTLRHRASKYVKRNVTERLLLRKREEELSELSEQEEEETMETVVEDKNPWNKKVQDKTHAITARPLELVLKQQQASLEDEVTETPVEAPPTLLPGWGSWSGKTEKKPTKKSFEKPRVRLNQSNAVKALQVKRLPFPFVSAEDFQSFAQTTPIARDFQPEQAFKLLTQPRVVTKKGGLIHPMT